MIGHNLSYCTIDGQQLDFASPYITKAELVDDRRRSRRGKMSVSLSAHSSLCIRRDVFQHLYPLPNDIRMGIDNYLKWVILSLFPVLLVRDNLAIQRIHGSNVGTILAEKGGAVSPGSPR